MTLFELFRYPLHIRFVQRSKVFVAVTGPLFKRFRAGQFGPFWLDCLLHIHLLRDAIYFTLEKSTGRLRA